jgi:hypothetical protein
MGAAELFARYPTDHDGDRQSRRVWPLMQARSVIAGASATMAAVSEDHVWIVAAALAEGASKITPRSGGRAGQARLENERDAVLNAASIASMFTLPAVALGAGAVMPLPARPTHNHVPKSSQ